MGLLEKSLKKTGKTRNTPAKPEKIPEEKRSVGWLSGSFGERTSALADKIDLEAQYARLEAMSSSHAAPPPKISLRDRALKLLSGAGLGKAPVSPVLSAPAPKRSLRERAQQFIRKISGGGSGESGAAGGSHEQGGVSQSNTPGDDTQGLSDHEQELHNRTLFPWWALAEGEHAEGLHSAFGHEHAEPLQQVAETVAEPQPQAVVEETADAARSPLEDFADTIGRITDNLKNLHVQLDAGNFIRNIQVEPTPAAQAFTPPLISHHVPVDGPAAAPQSTAGGVAVESPPVPQAAAPQPKEAARDVFWPRELPLDLPARDVRINADGSVSVVPGPFQLPYLAEDIAPPAGELSHFTRNLKNAELFIGEGELQLTRIIYERLLQKITDAEAKRKIRANLDALDNYRKSHDWGSFMPIAPWMRNPWQDMKPPQLSVSEMPVEAKNITINLDKGFFEIAKAIFEQQKELIQSVVKEKKDDAAAAGAIEDDEGGAGAGDGDEGGDAEAEERRADEDRRKGAPDPRGEGAPDRRSGKDRRADALEENAPPPPLAEDGEAAAAPEPEGAPEAEAAGAPDAAGAEDEPLPDGVMEPPKIPEMSPDGQAMAPDAGEGDEGGGEDKEEENKVQEIRGVLELKTPDQEDTPFLTLTYDFTKIPHAYRLAKDNGIFEYAYYKYKPMLVKAHQFIRRKQITRALNYYRVIREQQIPTEFRHMVDRNIKDITEYLQKYLVTRQN
ncbi:hypothetical protein [Turneriella parva]|uniref:Uncharacterized protein n=1 Tax=Turneriella parva (strain ATCC BAA-1111 / DSM 21527 / NCTC 11395 / H) TaxID=869212 RepID=I4BB94_TURPD|nr:hypothetical protein [Turneriella parva]AFM14551.1 hypothetical protein Turpa_3917 [Turneriella parva DSM 21527]